MNSDTEQRLDKAHVFLAVSGFDNAPEAITSILGFPPTEVWSVGDPLPNHPTAKRRHSRWSFHSPLPLSAHVEEHLDALLALLEPHAARIRDCTERFPTALCCAIYYYQDFNPGFRISEAALQRSAALGIPIEFDLYFLGGTDSNRTKGV